MVVLFLQEHRFCHFRLTILGWFHTEVIHGRESVAALNEGLQNALAACGGVPLEPRSDCLSAGYAIATATSPLISTDAPAHSAPISA